MDIESYQGCREKLSVGLHSIKAPLLPLEFWVFLPCLCEKQNGCFWLNIDDFSRVRHLDPIIVPLMRIHASSADPSFLILTCASWAHDRL